MCKLVAELTGSDTRKVGEVFQRLENSCGQPGLDVRLTGEIYGKTHMKMRALGLDPNDTTPKELYQALLNITALHDSFIAKRLGINKSDDSAKIGKSIALAISKMSIPKNTWGLKSTVVKKILLAHPPKVLMKLLGYRSLDSMIKHESPAVLLAIARLTEPDNWHEKIVNKYKKLNSNEFEDRQIEIEYLDNIRWKNISNYLSKNHRTNIVHSQETGVVVLLPIDNAPKQGLTLISLLLTLHYLNEIRVFSTFIKFHFMRSDFGNIFAKRATNIHDEQLKLAGQTINWKIMHRYYGAADRLNHPEIFEPHLQPEDLSYRKAEEVLYKLEPALHFWHDNDYVGLPLKDGPISFSLTDMAMNLVNRLPYEKRVYYHMQDSLWNEIYCRYIGQSNFEKQILSQLDDQSVGLSLRNVKIGLAG